MRQWQGRRGVVGAQHHPLPSNTTRAHSCFGGARRPAFTVGQVIKWWLGLPPGYLDVAQVRREVLQALAEWAEVVPVFFTEVWCAAGCFFLNALALDRGGLGG